MGLREDKKQRTRQEIAETAMRLFVMHGFDQVTVAEVATEARVSEKTVFNYFPTKEDLFFDEVPQRQAALVAAVRNLRPGESLLTALHRLQYTECSRLASPGFAIFARIIEQSSALQAKELEVMAEFSRVLNETIQTELGVGERDARIVAGLLVSVHRHFFRFARQQALQGKHGPGAVRRLRADLDRAYDLLEHGLGEFGRPAEAALSS